MVDLTDCDRSRIRLALEDKIYSILTNDREWTSEAIASYQLYQKLNGYFSMEQLEKFAKIGGNGK